MALNAQLAFDQYETWNVKLNQAKAITNKPQPMLLDIAWQGIDRAVPYIGWLSSDNGQTNITLKEGQQDIFVSTTVKPHEKTVLPTGKYDARLDVKGSLLDIENFRYQAENGSLSGLAKIKLPTENSNSHGVQRLKQIISIHKL